MQLSDINVKELTRLKNDQILQAVKGNKHFGIYDDGSTRTSIEETYFPYPSNNNFFPFLPDQN